MGIIDVIVSEESTSFAGIGNNNIVFIPVQDNTLGAERPKLYTLSTVSALMGNTELDSSTKQYTMAKNIINMGYTVLYYAVSTVDNTVYDILRDRLNYDVTYIICSDYPQQALQVAQSRGDCLVLIDDWFVSGTGQYYIQGTDGRYLVNVSGSTGTSEPNSQGIQYQLTFSDSTVSAINRIQKSSVPITSGGKFTVTGISGLDGEQDLSTVVWGNDGTFTISSDSTNTKFSIQGDQVVYNRLINISVQGNTETGYYFTDNNSEPNLTYNIVLISSGLASIDNAEDYYTACKNMFISMGDSTKFGYITCPCKGNVAGSEAYLSARAKRITSNPVYLPVMGVSNGGVGNLVPKFHMGTEQWNLWQNIQGTTAVGADNDGFRINPIVNIPSYGYCIMGNSTLMASPQATRKYFSFANIQMLIAQIQKIVYNASLYKLGESNDIIAWNSYKELITPYLDTMVQGRGMAAYKLRKLDKDSQGNIPPKGVVWAELVIIKPIESIEQFVIYLNVTDGTISVA